MAFRWVVLFVSIPGQHRSITPRYSQRIFDMTKGVVCLSFEFRDRRQWMGAICTSFLRCCSLSSVFHLQPPNLVVPGVLPAHEHRACRRKEVELV